MSEHYASLPIEQIEPDPAQPRREMESLDDPALTEVRTLHGLAGSIREFGILQPIRVRPIADDGGSLTQDASGATHTRYRIVSGGRRYEAAKLAGLTVVPTVIETRDDSAETRLMKQVTENFQRKALTATELALAIDSLLQRGASRDEVEKRLGVQSSQITILLSLLKLSDPVKVAFARGRIESPRAAYDLNRLPPSVQEQMIAQAESKGRVIGQKDVTQARKTCVRPGVKRHRFEEPAVTTTELSLLLSLLADGPPDPYDPTLDRDAVFGEGWRNLMEPAKPANTPAHTFATEATDEGAVVVPGFHLSHAQAMCWLDWLVTRGVVRGEELDSIEMGASLTHTQLGEHLAQWMGRL